MNNDRIGFSHSVRFVSTDPTHNRARFYVLSVQTTL